MITIDRERLISEKQNNKASPEGARLVSSFWTHQQGLPGTKRFPPIALTLTFIKQTNTKHKTRYISVLNLGRLNASLSEGTIIQNHICNFPHVRKEQGAVQISYDTSREKAEKSSY